MAAQQESSKSLKSVTGAAFVALGLLILFANVDGVVSCMSSFAGISAHEALAILPALGLAGLHTLQAYTFDRTGFFSGLQQILVSFWPILLVIFGVVLLRYAFKGRSEANEARLSTSASGDRS
jgi:hypothetical protein